MIRRLSCLFALIVLLGALPIPAAAQEGGQRYESTALGVAFDLPAGWQVSEAEDKLLAAAPADLPLVQQGSVPQGLAVFGETLRPAGQQFGILGKLLVNLRNLLALRVAGLRFLEPGVDFRGERNDSTALMRARAAHRKT